MHTLVGLLVVLVVAFVLSTTAATVFVREVPPIATGFAIAASVVMGYLMATPFLQWQPLDGVVKRRFVFPSVASTLGVISAFMGLGPVFAWAYGASLVPAHAGMSGWFLGIIASTVVIVLASRFVDCLITRATATSQPLPLSWNAVSNVEDASTSVAGSAVAGPSWESAATRGAGVILLLFLMIGQGVAGPLIFLRFGPDASYRTAIASLARSIIFLAPLATIAGFALEKTTRGRRARRRWISFLIILVALVAIGEVSCRFTDARDSEEARWWIEYQESRR